MTSGCIFKNGAPTQVLRKLRILIKFGLRYTMRGNVKIRKMQISFNIVYLLTKLCNIFDEAFFIDVSIQQNMLMNINEYY